MLPWELVYFAWSFVRRGLLVRLHTYYVACVYLRVRALPDNKHDEFVVCLTFSLLNFVLQCADLRSRVLNSDRVVTDWKTRRMDVFSFFMAAIERSHDM